MRLKPRTMSNGEDAGLADHAARARVAVVEDDRPEAVDHLPHGDAAEGGRDHVVPDIFSVSPQHSHRKLPARAVADEPQNPRPVERPAL